MIHIDILRTKCEELNRQYVANGNLPRMVFEVLIIFPLSSSMLSEVMKSYGPFLPLRICFARTNQFLFIRM